MRETPSVARVRAVAGGSEVREVAGSARVAPVPRLALTIEEACAALGVSWDFWQAHIASDLRVVRRGRKKLVPVRELERWLEREAETVFE